jgi:hypothetical protein
LPFLSIKFWDRYFDARICLWGPESDRSRHAARIGWEKETAILWKDGTNASIRQISRFRFIRDRTERCKKER